MTTRLSLFRTGAHWIRGHAMPTSAWLSTPSRLRAAGALTGILLAVGGWRLSANATGNHAATDVAYDTVGADAGRALEPWPPLIKFSPASRSFTADDALPSDSLAVTIDWCDDQALDGSKRWIRINGTTVTSQFSYVVLPPDVFCGARAQSVGKVKLVEGQNKLIALITDFDLKGTDTASYTYRPHTYGVAVGPKQRSISVRASQPSSETFAVTNTGSTAVSFTLTRTCVSPATGCSGVSSTSTLPAGASDTVTISFAAAASGSNGQIKLTASRTNGDGSISADSAIVTVDLGIEGTPAVSVLEDNAGTRIARDRCLTLALGSNAAVECGDLRLVRALPTTRTLSRDRTPMLLYNSSNAAPGLRVAAHVNMPNIARPDEVEATLTVNGAPFTRRWVGSDWGTNAAQRVTIAINDVSLPTGVYPYTLAVRNRYGANYSSAATVSGHVTVVNRSSSPFGAGWWLAGLEQLTIPASGDSILWVGGDGSTRIYVNAGTDRWLAPTLDRVDSLRKSGNEYIRYLPNKLRTVFDLSGRHVRTVNRLGHVTRFVYGSGLLDTLIIPVADSSAIPSSSASRRYAFSYTSGRLASVTAPPAPQGTRVTVLGRAFGDDRVTSIQDPDSHSVSFGYMGSTNRIRSRTDRRGTVHSFGYDLAHKVAADTLFMQSTADLVQRYTAAESQGAANDGTQRRSVHVDSAFARLNGPRSDVADFVTFWVNAIGNVTRIRNALGDTTSVSYGNSTFPALPTQVRQPNGLVMRAVYNGRGLIDSSIVVDPYGTGLDAITTYTWGMAEFDVPTKVVGPLGESTRVEYGYSDTTGNRNWQQDSRGTASRVEFRYYPATGLLRAAEAPNGGIDSLAYDARGNVTASVTPLGYVTSAYPDALGRDTLVIFPIDAAHNLRRRFVYDIVSQLRETIDSAPALPYTLRSLTADTSTVHALQMRLVYTYDAEGNRKRVQSFSTDLSDVQTDVTYTYDRAHRLTQRGDGKMRSFTLDPAGNPVAIVLAGGKTITQRFDAVNRLVRRTSVAVTYPKETCSRYPIGPLSSTPCQMVFPYYPNDGTSYRVSEDAAVFAYDAAGNMIRADNRYARIRRAYFPNGQLASDTLKFGSLTSPELDGRVRHQSFTYDLAGRRSTMAWELGTTTYEYHDFGPLKQVTDPQGNVYRWSYDLATQVDTFTVAPPNASPAIREFRRYYVDGSPRWRRRESDPLGHLLGDSLAYDRRGKVKEAFRTSRVTNQSEHASMRYDGMGALLAYERTRSGGSGYDVEEYRNDAFGNAMWSKARNLAGGAEMWYHSSYSIAGALVSRWSEMPATLPSGAYDDDLEQEYGGEGLRSLSQLKQAKPSNDWLRQEAARYYYDGEARLAVVQRYSWTPSGTVGVWEEYWYDALGRRVLTRTRREGGVSAPSGSTGLCTVTDGRCRSYTERTSWDGNQILVEQRDAEGTSDASNSGTVYYIHGPEIDRPVAVRRNSTTHVLNYNWRGLAESSVTPSGHPADCSLQTSGCTVRVRWPSQAGAYYTTHHASTSPQGVITWLGALPENGAGASGMLYRRNRYFDPTTGRFTQQDPIGLAGGLNLYGFAEGDPVNFVDPFGLNSCDPDDYLCLFGRAGWQILGGLLGMAGGGAGGFVVGTVTCGPPHCTLAGTGVGAAAGGAYGAAKAGELYDNILEAARAGKGGGNVAENRGSTYYARKYRLNKDGAEQLKRALEEAKRAGEEITDDFLEAEARAISGVPKYVKPK